MDKYICKPVVNGTSYSLIVRNGAVNVWGAVDETTQDMADTIALDLGMNWDIQHKCPLYIHGTYYEHFFFIEQLELCPTGEDSTFLNEAKAISAIVREREGCPSDGIIIVDEFVAYSDSVPDSKFLEPIEREAVKELSGITGINIPIAGFIVTQ